MKPLERLHLEVTNVCNFKCEFCPDNIMKRHRGHMAWPLLEQILDEVAPHRLCRVVAFHLMGEPLIYPDFFSAIHGAIQRGLKLHLTTNGSTFHLIPEQIEALVRSQVPKVTISLQTPNPGTFVLRGAPPRLTAADYFAGITRYVQANLQHPAAVTRIHVKVLDTTPHPFLVPHKPIAVVAGAVAMRSQLWDWAQRLMGPQVQEEASIQRAIAAYRPGRWHLIPLH
jgi:organic radical activating enzyme